MTEDLTAFFADFAVTAIWSPSVGGGSHATRVLFDMPGHTMLTGMALATEYAITYRATDFIGLDNGETVVVNGTTFRVREVVPLSDGALCQASLSKVTP